MPTVTTPSGAKMPKNVLRALLVVTIWCKENGYTVKIFKKGPSK
jgi:hypothetical protein